MILDTNALSAFAEGEHSATERIAEARLIALPAIVLGEYRYGIALSRRKTEYQRWLDELIPMCQVLDVDGETAVRYATVRLELRRAGTPIPVNDTWIAALCRQHSLPLLSQDAHFDGVKGIRRIAW